MLAEKVVAHAEQENAKAEIEENATVKPGKATFEQVDTWNTRQGIDEVSNAIYDQDDAGDHPNQILIVKKVLNEKRD